MTKHTKIID